jgi:aminopeptidase N
MKRFFLVLFLGSVFLSDSGYGQASLTRKRPYDVLSYKLTLDWRPVFKNKSTRFSGVNEITLTLLESVDSVVLDAADMLIDSIRINGNAAPLVRYPAADETLTIMLPDSLRSKGQTVVLKIGYFHNITTNEGLYFYPKNMYVGLGPAKDSVFTEEDLAFTMSEPLDAHRWMPCNDLPYDKANSEISIIVPPGNIGISNGTLQGVQTNSDSSKTYTWKSDEPVSTYLMVADASNFVQWSDYYARLSDPSDHVPVVFYAWPSDYSQTADTTGLKYNAQYALRNTPQMLAAFSKLFGEFPFVKYGQVPVQPFGFGGMEHQTLTTINRSWLRGKDEDGIAHELTHQWFGDKTTCETWNDIWLNEGFASYGEAVWEESIRGKVAYANVIQEKVNSFMHPYTQYGQTNSIPMYAPPIDNIFNYPTTYCKGACVLHMLRRILGDTLFFNTLRDYSSAFAYKNANTIQFRDFIQARAGEFAPISLNDFVDQWAFRPDWPIYTITWAQDAQNRLYVKVVQSQDSTDHYSMPLRFFASYDGNRDTLLTLVNDARSQTFVVPLPAPIIDLAFDEDAVVLSNYSIAMDDQLSVSAPTRTPETLHVFSMSGRVKLSFSQVVSERAEVEIIDLLGRTVIRQSVAGMNEVSFDRLSHGSYFAMLKDGDTRLTAKFTIEK